MPAGSARFMPHLHTPARRLAGLATGRSASGPRSTGRGSLPVTAPRRSAVCSASCAAVITPAANFCASVVRLRDSDPSPLPRQAPRRDAAQRALAGVAALPLDLPFARPAAGPQPGQLPADPRRPDHGQQPGAAPGLVLGQAPLARSGRSTRRSAGRACTAGRSAAGTPCPRSPLAPELAVESAVTARLARSTMRSAHRLRRVLAVVHHSASASPRAAGGVG